MLLDTTVWMSEPPPDEEPFLRVDMPEPHVATYGDNARGIPKRLTVRIGEAVLIPGFREFQVQLVLRQTGEFVLVDRIE